MAQNSFFVREGRGAHSNNSWHVSLTAVQSMAHSPGALHIAGSTATHSAWCPDSDAQPAWEEGCSATCWLQIDVGTDGLQYIWLVARTLVPSVTATPGLPLNDVVQNLHHRFGFIHVCSSGVWRDSAAVYSHCVRVAASGAATYQSTPVGAFCSKVSMYA